MFLKDLIEGIQMHTCWICGSGETQVSALTADSRKVVPGAVFVCISGTVSDGHDFMNEALERGAAVFVVERVPEEFCTGGILSQGEGAPAVIVTENTRKALAHMAAVWYDHPAEKLITIGVTGTKGKTTTTYMIRSILENAGCRVGLIGTNEVIVGREHRKADNTTPDSLTLHGLFREMVAAGLDTVVMEVSSQAIRMCRTEGILFDYGIFTNLSPDHISPAEHDSFEDYLGCKRQLFSHCRIGLVNGDDPWMEAVTEGHTCVLETYGLGEKCMLRAENVELIRREGKAGSAFQVTGKMDFPVTVPLPGKFSVYNALAAISLCRHFHVRESDIQRALLSAKVRGRIEMVDAPEGCTIIIDYAHNPLALESLLQTLREYQPGHLICLFGCGGNRPALRRREMGRISGRMADLSILTSDNPRWEKPESIIEEIREGVEEVKGRYVVIPDRREAIKYGINVMKKGDILVLAGKGHEDYQETGGNRYPMDERELVREILKE